MMDVFTYPSKKFRRAWRKAIDDKIEFRVDAKIANYRKNHVTKIIDVLSSGIGQFRRAGFLSMLLGGDLTGCILNAFISKIYHVDYSELDNCLVITFRKKKTSS